VLCGFHLVIYMLTVTADRFGVFDLLTGPSAGVGVVIFYWLLTTNDSECGFIAFALVFDVSQ
jgi:hypothetical protein